MSADAVRAIDPQSWWKNKPTAKPRLTITPAQATALYSAIWERDLLQQNAGEHLSAEDIAAEFRKAGIEVSQ